MSSQGTEAKDVATWVAWGIDYLKRDNCGLNFQVVPNQQGGKRNSHFKLCNHFTSFLIYYYFCSNKFLSFNAFGLKGRSAMGPLIWRFYGIYKNTKTRVHIFTTNHWYIKLYFQEPNCNIISVHKHEDKNKNFY